MIRFRLSLILVLFGVLSAGCESFTPPEPTFTVRDSAGIEIVESSAPLLGPDAWTISEEPVLQIGELEGEDPYLFARIPSHDYDWRSGVFSLADGRIVVCNGLDLTVRFFDENGEFINQVGGRGEGPGELSFIYSCVPTADGFAVNEGRRLSFFDPEGGLIKAFRPSSITSQRFYVQGIFPDHSLLLSESVSVSSDDQSPGLTDPTQEVFFSSVDDQVREWRVTTKTTRRFRGGESSGTQAFSPWGQTQVVGEQFVYGWADEFNLRYYDKAGKLVRCLRRSWEPVPVTEEDRVWWGQTYMDTERFTGREQSPAARRTFKQRVDNMIWPETHPAFDRLYPDRTRHTWVRRHHTRWHPRYRGVSVRFPHDWTWDVFDPAGRWLTTLSTPGGFEVHDIGEDYILGVWKDEMDVEYVRMYSLDRGG